MSINAPNKENFSVSRRNPNSSTPHGDGPRGIVACERMTFLEAHATAAGVTTNYVNLPAGSVLVDIVVSAEVLPTGTSASLDVGDDDDPNGWLAGVDLKATDLTLQQNLSISGNLATAGGKIGAYGNVGTNTHLTDRYHDDGGHIIATVTWGASPNDVGVTHVDVLYAIPYSTFGTFVAS